ncbi:cellulose binding domain-containing protein [Streptomyces sp. NPDC047028]|uniref:cellulose binding domain-containing protein n=1 Tax=Streptomyces sp. NPDC047028 TaxID=3155793 RepID=UPI00340F1F78
MIQRISPAQQPRRSLLGAEQSSAGFDRLLDDHSADVALAYTAQCITDDRAARRLVATLTGPPRVQEPRGTDGLPVVPHLLLHIRVTAEAWRRRPARAVLLNPAFVDWLDTVAAHPAAPHLAFRSLRDMSLFDAELLWWSQVEALPVPPLATALGWDPGHTAQVVHQAVIAYVERCRANHLGNARRQPRCRSYAALLEAAVRRDTGERPAELQEHLAGCADCTELYECLDAARHGRLGEVIAEAVLGWGGAAYAAARRRAPHPVTAPAGPRAARRRRSRPPLLVVTTVVVAVAATAVAVSRAYPGERVTAGAGPTAPPLVSPPLGDLPGPPPVTSGPTAHDTARVPPPGKSPAAQPPSSGTPAADGGTRGRHTDAGGGPSAQTAPAPCTSHLTVDDDWGDGAKVYVNVTTRAAVSGWRLDFDIAPGTTIRNIWNGHSTTDGRHVTVTPADYNRSLDAGGSLDVGFVYDGSTAARDWITGVTLDGGNCAPS